MDILMLIRLENRECSLLLRNEERGWLWYSHILYTMQKKRMLTLPDPNVPTVLSKTDCFRKACLKTSYNIYPKYSGKPFHLNPSLPEPREIKPDCILNVPKCIISPLDHVYVIFQNSQNSIFNLYFVHFICYFGLVNWWFPFICCLHKNLRFFYRNKAAINFYSIPFVFSCV